MADEIMRDIFIKDRWLPVQIDYVQGTNAVPQMCIRDRQETGSGMTVIAWQKLTDKGKLLVDSWYLSLLDINREYNCIKFI